MDAETCLKMVKDLDKLAEFRRAAVKLASALIELDVGPLTLEERERIKQYVNDQARCIIELEKTL